INSSSVEAARRAGYGHTSYLPHAVDASVFRPMADVAKDTDFCFVGLWSEKRQRFIEAALDVSESGAVYGPKWTQKTFRDRRFRTIRSPNWKNSEKNCAFTLMTRRRANASPRRACNMFARSTRTFAWSIPSSRRMRTCRGEIAHEAAVSLDLDDRVFYFSGIV